MKKLPLFSFLVFLGVLFAACNKDVDSSAPRCISKKIKSFEKEACDDARVDAYYFDSEKVYVFELGTCIADGQSEVYSEDCELLGSLGGLMGNSTIQGKSFGSAQFEKTIWKP